MLPLHPINFDNSYARELEGFYVPWQGDKAPSPEIVQFNTALAAELGLDPAALKTPRGAAFFAGSEMPDGATPLSQVYAGHQFGGFSHQLGDGRALLVGEVIDQNGQRRDIQLKGSGRTPFSRGGDGKAALGPVLREYLMGEAMHALGIPTTRALAAVTTGEQIARETLLPGAVLTRVASSHLRVGTFQFFAARQEVDKLRQLADYSIQRHFPEIADDENPYLSLLQQVIDRQALLVAKWVSVGFVHGVMNTDNMTISGETIDYGPCAFIDSYDPKALFSSIDELGRYAYGNQPNIAQWNLARFAETLLPLIDPEGADNAVRLATNELNQFTQTYLKNWQDLMRGKLGLTGSNDDDITLVNDFHSAMEGQNVDFTQAFRRLSAATSGDTQGVQELFTDRSTIQKWLDRWLARLKQEEKNPDVISLEMDRVNPIYIPRNHKVEEALQAATNDANYAPFQKLLDVLSLPFEERDGLEDYAKPAPGDFGPYKTFCGT